LVITCDLVILEGTQEIFAKIEIHYCEFINFIRSFTGNNRITYKFNTFIL